MITIKRSFKIFAIFLITSCAVPGIDSPGNSFFGGTPVFYNGNELTIPIININKGFNDKNKYSYIISNGDVISMIIWGQDEAFPLTGGGYASSPIYSRLVNENGDIFVPYIGNVNIAGSTMSQARTKITNALSKEFINPQIDINLEQASNINRVYIQGEIKDPIEIELNVSPLSLSSAINKASGLNLNTANASNIFIIRSHNNDPKIYKLNLKTANAYITASSFYLYPQDIVYVGTSSITKWNRYVSQIFPFASFLNQIDQVDAR